MKEYLISAQAAVEEIARRDTTDGNVKVFSGQEIISILHSMPQAVPRMRGKWIEEEDYSGDTIYKCSECGDEFVLIDGTPKDNNYFFCPACGADMREGHNGENMR